MAKKKIRFTNFWGDEISKQQYVDDKIRVLSEMELFSHDSIVNEKKQAEKLRDLRHWIRRILMSYETEVQIDSLTRMLIVGRLSPTEFVERYHDRINDGIC